jgi:Phenol hydroxylase, C-terminal dimerisation domain
MTHTEFQKYFVRQGRFTAGTETRYRPSIISAKPTYQHLAKGFVIGMRFHSALVSRLADAKRLQLGHTAKADDRWRLFVFSGAEDPIGASSGINSLCDFLARSPCSPVIKYTPKGMAAVRPDQYIAYVLPLHAHAELASFFDAFMLHHD